MNTRVRVLASHLKEALKVANTVKPSSNGVAGFAFTIEDGRCFVNSLGSLNDCVRVELPVLEIEGDASFVYPVDRVEAFQYMAGWVDIESGSDDKGGHWFQYKTEEGATARGTTFDPKLLPTISTWLAEAQQTEAVTFPSAVLKEALIASGRYLSTETEDNGKPFQTLQIFDASNPAWAAGDGTMLATNGSRACFFHSSAFKGKGLVISQKHVDYLRGFLSKCHKTVKVVATNSMMFAIDQVPDGDTFRDGSVYGWVRSTKTHSAYKYYSFNQDQYVLNVPKDTIVRSLKWLKSEMGKDSRLRIEYNSGKLKFLGGRIDTAETAAVDVTPQKLENGSESGTSFEAFADIHAFMDLFDNVKGHNVDLRVANLAGTQNRFVFRTFEKVTLNDDAKIAPEGNECLVTYFTMGTTGH